MERGLLLIRAVDILQLALLISPVLGAACGYLVDGVTGATSGLVMRTLGASRRAQLLVSSTYAIAACPTCAGES